MSKYLVTGGAGFIGSNISKKLVELGHEVTIIDNLLTGKKENIANILDKVNFLEIDIRDIDALKKAFKGIDYILHQAALPSVQRSVENPSLSNEINVQGTVNVLIAAKDMCVKRVVYAGSSSAYGNTPKMPKEESMASNPLSPYAISKLTGENYCKVFYKIYGLETVILRYFNVFGPNQDPTSQYSAVIPKFITAMLKDEAPTIYGDGLTSRDFSYIDNNIHANILAAETTNKDALGEMVNIACGERFSLNDMVDGLNEIMKKKIKPDHDAERKGDVKHSLADISKAKKLIGYKPKVKFKEGLKKTVEWYKNKSG